MSVLIKRRVAHPVLPLPRVIRDGNHVTVVVKECFCTGKWLEGDWVCLFWQKYRPPYTPWYQIAGFTLYCPPQLRLSGVVKVTEIMDRIVRERTSTFDCYRDELYELAQGLFVTLPISQRR